MDKPSTVQYWFIIVEILGDTCATFSPFTFIFIDGM